MDQAKDRGAFRVVSGAGERTDRTVRDPAQAERPSPTPQLPTPPSRDRRAARGLAAVMARIREDAQVEPGDWLEACEVPGGGE